VSRHRLFATIGSAKRGSIHLIALNSENAAKHMPTVRGICLFFWRRASKQNSPRLWQSVIGSCFPLCRKVLVVVLLSPSHLGADQWDCSVFYNWDMILDVVRYSCRIRLLSTLSTCVDNRDGLEVFVLTDRCVTEAMNDGRIPLNYAPVKLYSVAALAPVLAPNNSRLVSDASNRQRSGQVILRRKHHIK
jgi:hypothetical protein